MNGQNIGLEHVKLLFNSVDNQLPLLFGQAYRIFEIFGKLPIFENFPAFLVKKAKKKYFVRKVFILWLFPKVFKKATWKISIVN